MQILLPAKIHKSDTCCPYSCLVPKPSIKWVSVWREEFSYFLQTCNLELFRFLLNDLSALTQSIHTGLSLCYTPSHNVTYYQTMSHTIIQCHRPSHNVTYYHTMSQTITQWHRLSHNVTDRHTMSQTVTQCHIVSTMN